MRAWLREKGVEVAERDFFEKRLSEAELRQLLKGRSPSELFAWNSPSFRLLGVPAQHLDDRKLMELMLGEPRLIRRPLVQVGGQLIIGGAQKGLDAAFP